MTDIKGLVVMVTGAGVPSDIAETAVFLAGQDYITAENIVADGGRGLGARNR